MLTKESIYAVITSILCIIVIMAISSFALRDTVKGPKVEDGVIDLSGYHLSESKEIALDGEWGYYEGELISPIQVSDYNLTTEVEVPKHWNQYDLQRNGNPAYGYGTFLLTILIHPQDLNEVLAFKVQNIGMSSQLWIDSELLYSNGLPAITKGSYQMRNVPYTVHFTPKQQEIHVAIQVANFDYSPYSGIVSSIKLGSSEAINKNLMKNIGYEFLLSSSYLVVGLIFLMLYFQRKAERFLLFFFLYNFSGLFYVITHGEKLWYLIFPSFPYALFAKIQYLSAALNLLAYLLYLYYSFPKLFYHRRTRGLILIASIFVPICIFPLQVQSYWSAPQILLFQVVMLYTTYIFIRGIYLHYEYSAYIALASLSSFFMVSQAVQIVLGKANTDISMVAAQLIWVLLQAFLIAARFSKTYDLKEQYNKELQMIDKYKDDFLAKTSHEFRTPLHGIINILRIFLEKEIKHLPATEVENLSLAIEIASRLSRLVNDILDLSRIREGKIHMQLETVEIKRQLEDITLVLQFAYREIPCNIKLILPEEDTYIQVDRDRFKQIFYNLLDNALKHTKEGKVDLTVEVHNEDISIEVRNFGQNPALPENIFEPYVQGAGTEAEGGYGLGLSIVKSLVEMQHGSIELRHDERSSIAFIVRFRKVRHEKSIQEKTEDEMRIQIRSEKLAELGRKNSVEGSAKVLVVDDNPMNLKVIVDALSIEHYHIIPLTSGKETLTYLDQHKGDGPDLVLIDVMMPEMSGYVLSAELRKRMNLVELPILFITAATNRMDSRIAMEHGANDFLYKPFDLTELRARVHTLISMKRLATEKARFEIAFLHAQIKPHFLYNALNTIASSCEESSPETADLIVSLARYLRGTLDFANIGELVPLEREIGLVKAYLDIERARFPVFQASFINVDKMSALIPPLSIQILVENALKHGLAPNSYYGQICISMEVHDAKLRVIVTDIREERDETDSVLLAGKVMRKLDDEFLQQILERPGESGSIGLYNVNQRLKNVGGSGILLFKAPSNGTSIGFDIEGGEWNV